jgi:hypothetical protein
MFVDCQSITMSMEARFSCARIIIGSIKIKSWQHLTPFGHTAPFSRALGMMLVLVKRGSVEGVFIVIS